MKYLSILFLILLLNACNNTPKADNTSTIETETTVPALAPSNTAPITVDTLVAKLDVTKTIPGAEYLNKAISYCVMTRLDTSAFKCHFSRWKADSTLFFVTRFSPHMSYRAQYNELRYILKEASKDFDLGAIRTIGLGRLVESGDLAVEVSREYFRLFGDKDARVRKEVNDFLVKSKLATDFNTLLKPYNLTVSSVIIEKPYFAPSSVLAQSSKIESGAGMIPKTVLDCVVYLKIGR